MTARTVWFNCCAGVAGDMLLASLVDAGADVDAIADGLAELGVDGYAVAFERVQRCGVGATWANVDGERPRYDDGTTTSHSHALTVRPRDVLELIGAADLPDRVRDRALAVYRALAEVEGEIHGVAADDVELHEVGALDSIIDVVGVCVALEVLGIDTIVCSPIAVGHGTVRTQPTASCPTRSRPSPRCSHGPALRSVGIDTTMETATPTGVALDDRARPSDFGALPSMTVRATGFGAGTADPPGRPNVVQAVVGDADVRLDDPATPDGRPDFVEANVDDVTGEVLAHTIAELARRRRVRRVGDSDRDEEGPARRTPCTRCATMRRSPPCSGVMIAETGTLGIRATTVERWPQHREERHVDVGGQRVRVKVSGSRVKAEHDDAVAAAAVLGIPLRDVLRRAETADADGPHARVASDDRGIDPDQPRRLEVAERRRADPRRQLRGRQRRAGGARRCQRGRQVDARANRVRRHVSDHPARCRSKDGSA